MSTYDNCYKIVEDVRDDIGEYSEDIVRGTTEGEFRNAWIIRMANNAQRRLYGGLLRRIPEQFLSSIAASVSSSSFTLPWDFGRLVRYEDENGYKVYRSDVNALPISGGIGSDKLYYRQGNTLILNKTGVTETYKLWYR